MSTNFRHTRSRTVESDAALAAMSGAGVGFVRFDGLSRIVEWSTHCEQLFGRSAAEVTGRRLGDVALIHRDDLSLMQTGAARLDDPDVNEFDVFVRAVSRTGEVRHVSWHQTVVRDVDGAVEHSVAVVVDRTKEVLAQHSLEEERNLFVAGPTMVFRWSLDPGVVIHYASPNIQNVLGFHPSDLVSGYVPLMQWLHIDDIDHFLEQLTAFDGSHQQQWTFDPLRLVGVDGRVVAVRIFASRIPAAGESREFAAYAVDITRLHDLQAEAARHEARLRNVIEGTNAGTWEWNVETGETRFNDRWADIVGYTLEELSPTSIDTWMGLAHPDDLNGSNLALESHFEGLTAFYDFESRMQHKDGHWVWVHDRGKVVEWTPEGKPLWVAGTHIDISRRKVNEEKLLAANEALRASNVELEQFAYIASHDLQEPLRMVASFTQLLEQRYGDQLDDRAQEYIRFAADGATRMQSLIRDLLSYSRVGRQNLDETVINLEAVIDRVQRSLHLAIEESGATIVMGDMPVIRADIEQTYQLFQNLIENALKYRRDKDVRIQVHFNVEGDRSVIAVTDNGIGIEAQHAERIFQIFQRLHTRAEYPGTGIGLSICKRIVERLDGEIWFESEPGQGTTFYIALPSARVIAPTQRKPAVLEKQRVA